MTIRELYEQVRDGRIISDIELQREIIYDNNKKVLVVDSIVKGIPLPAFYLWKNQDGILEVLDGKQRIEAIKRFLQNDIIYNDKLWKQTDAETQRIILETDLSVIICSGEEALKREIFRRINTLGVPLSTYEVLNGLYHGEYLRGLTLYVEKDRDARKVLGSNSRGKNQYKILKMLSGYADSSSINDYVKSKQNDSFSIDQKSISKYIKFIADIFDDNRQLDILFLLAKKYLKDLSIWKMHSKEINAQIQRYLKSDDAKLTNKAREIENIINAITHGISVDKKRLFTADDKREYLRDREKRDSKYQCQGCKKWFFEEELTMDHVDPWSKGGRTVLSNAEVLCQPCNSKKNNWSPISDDKSDFDEYS